MRKPSSSRGIRAVHADPSADGPWRRSWSRAHVAFYALTRTTPVVTAAQVAERSDTSLGQTYNVANELRRIDSRWSTERKRGYRIAPCDCGGTSSILLAIPEPDGPVCTQCRRDRSAIEWPAEPYDRYKAHPDVDDRR